MTHHPMRYIRSCVALLILIAAAYLAVLFTVYLIVSIGRWIT